MLTADDPGDVESFVTTSLSLLLSPPSNRIPTHTPATLPPPRRLLIILNPTSGPGHGRDILQQRLVPLLRVASGVEWEVYETQAAGEARELVRRRKVLPDGILV
jgi:hypothetical protein